MRTAAGAPRQAGIPARVALYHGQHRAGTMSPVFRIVWAVLMPVWIVSASPASGGPPPNIIVLLADDLRWDALGCYGNRIVQTPNIDRLAAKGVRFRNHFVTTSICNVSRASLFSGQQARRHGIVDFATPFTERQWRETYPALLRAAGYRTGFIGKFGVGSNAAVKAMSDKV